MHRFTSNVITESQNVKQNATATADEMQLLANVNVECAITKSRLGKRSVEITVRLGFLSLW